MNIVAIACRRFRMLHALVSCVGEDAAMALIREYDTPATSMYVPRTMPPRHRIVKTIGAESAGFLCAQFGGLNITMPRATEIIRMNRDARIMERYRAGESVLAIALTMGESERTTYYAIRRAERFGEERSR